MKHFSLSLEFSSWKDDCNKTFMYNFYWWSAQALITALNQNLFISFSWRWVSYMYWGWRGVLCSVCKTILCLSLWVIRLKFLCFCRKQFFYSYHVHNLTKVLKNYSLFMALCNKSEKIYRSRSEEILCFIILQDETCLTPVVSSALWEEKCHYYF